MTSPGLGPLADLVQSCTLAGVDLDAGRDRTGFELHADTRSSRAVTWRKQSVSNAWVEGSYDVQAVRDNVTENVWVWVFGSSVSDFRKRYHWLVDQVDTPTWSLVWLQAGMTETWDCTFSDHTIETQREFQYANIGLVKINVMRRPRVVITYADGSGYTG
jgi:hypothetical protein